MAETEAAHGRATRRLESAEEALRAGRAGAPPLRGPGRRPGAGARRGPGRRRRRAAVRRRRRGRHPARPGRGRRRAGRTPSRPPPAPRWPPWSSRAARRPSRPWPGCARVGPPGRSSPSPTGRSGGGPGHGPAGGASGRGPSRSAPTCAPARAAGTCPGWTPRSTPCWPVPTARWADGPTPSTWPWPAPTWWWSPGTATGSRPPAGGFGPAGAWSPPPWSTRPGPGPTTAAAAASEAGDERTAARSAVESTRAAALEAVRSDDRNEVDHQTARAARQRVAEDRLALAAELEEIRRSLRRARRPDRPGHGPGRRARARNCPAWRRRGPRPPERAAAAREERKRIDERIAEAASLRASGRSARPAWSNGAGS